MTPDGAGVRAAPGARLVAGCVVLMGSPCQGMRVRARAVMPRADDQGRKEKRRDPGAWWGANFSLSVLMTLRSG